MRNITVIQAEVLFYVRHVSLTIPSIVMYFVFFVLLFFKLVLQNYIMPNC